MKVTKENNLVKITFKVSKEEFDAALDKAFEKNNANVTIKGFRKGHAPKSVYLKHYGIQSLAPDAIDFVVNEKMAAEVYYNSKFHIVSQPELNLKDDVDVFNEKGFEFEVSFYNYPEVTLGDYKELHVKKLSAKPSKEELAQEKDRLLKDEIVLEPKDGEVALGDHVKFDFTGYKDGEKFDGGEAKDYELKIGSGQFIPGFEDQMVGMKVNEEKDVNVTFPEEYFEKSLAGQPVVFKVLVHEIKAEIRPEITEELLKKLSIADCKTEKDLDNYVKEQVTARKEKQNEEIMNNEAIELAVKNASVEIPEPMIKERADSLRKRYEDQAKQYNIPLEMLLQFQGSTLEDFEKSLKENAEAQVRHEVVLDKIASTEKFKHTKKEIEELADKYASMYNIPKEELLDGRGKELISSELSYNKAVKLICDSKIAE